MKKKRKGKIALKPNCMLVIISGLLTVTHTGEGGSIVEDFYGSYGNVIATLDIIDKGYSLALESDVADFLEFDNQDLVDLVFTSFRDTVIEKVRIMMKMDIFNQPS